MLPLLLDLTGRTVLVVGGGSVGRRKAQAAVAGGARVRLVCLEEQPAELEAGIDWQRAPYEAHHLDGITLAFAAAPPAINARVAEDARARGIWVNVASEPRAGDFVLPAVLRRGGLTVAVSTQGAAPSLARAVRNQLKEALDPLLPEWVELLAELRAEVLAAIPDEALRREVFSGLARERWLQRLRANGVAVVRQEMREAIAQAAGGTGPQ